MTRPPGPLGDPLTVARTVHDTVAGFGPLQRFLDDPTVDRVCQVVSSSRDQVCRALLPALATPGWQL
ncbi:MAG TPA: hypothetical protein VFR13_11250, partial [Jiangellaceae bacterium]|nr:hypothetical protein [Jiangellaceae bacterium]